MIHGVKGNGTELIQVNHALFIKYSFIHTDIHNLADKSAVFLVVADKLTFKSHRKLIEKRSIDKVAFCNVPACLAYFDGFFITRSNTGIVAGNDVFRIGDADGECACFYYVLCSFMSVVNADGNLCFLADITAEPDISADTKVVEFWYGLKDYGIRYSAFGMPESYLKFQPFDECIAIILNEYIDLDKLFGGMNG